MEKNATGSKDNENSKSSKLLHRASLTSRLTTVGGGEVKGISRKEFKPTIPTRRKKHSAPDKPSLDKPVIGQPDSRFKERVQGKLAQANKFEKGKGVVNTKGRGRGKKEYIRATGGLFGGNESNFQAEDLLASGRTVAELEEEKYVDPFHQSTSETTPITLPINPRIDSKSKLLVGKSDTVAEQDREVTAAELLYRAPDDQTESTYLFNMPDVLPVDMSKLNLDDEENAKNEPTIHMLPEGYLGRLQILKSGKVRLMVGDVPLEVNMHSKSGFLQEILCCQTKSLDRGKVANIGTVPYTLSITPEYDQLIP